MVLTVPESIEVIFFILMMMTIMPDHESTNYYSPCTCARGNYSRKYLVDIVGGIKRCYFHSNLLKWKYVSMSFNKNGNGTGGGADDHS